MAIDAGHSAVQIELVLVLSEAVLVIVIAQALMSGCRPIAITSTKDRT